MPVGEEYVNVFVVKVNGRPLPDDVASLLLGGCVDDSSHQPDLFVLRFIDETASVLQDARIEVGVAVEIQVQAGAPGGPETLLEGEVTALDIEVGHAGMHAVVRGLDRSHRLFRGTRVEAYVDMTASDIANRVATRAGLTCRADATSAVLPHVTQDGVSDWEFLRRLAAENGRVIRVERSQLQFVKPTGATSATSASDARNTGTVIEWGVNLLDLRGTLTSDGQVPEVEVRGWDPRTKQEVVARKAAATVSAQLSTTPTKLADTFRAPSYRVGRAWPDQSAACAAAADALADHVAGGFAELEGTARGNPKLRAGTAVNLTGLGATFSGKYTLSSTRHEFSEDGYTTTFVAANTSERTLYGLANGSGPRGPRRLGVVPAVVTDVKDPDDLGRVKIKVPWLDDTYESGWARTVHAGAGAERGLVVLPEVNDEVLVAFAHDDFNHPYVLGGLFNGVDKPAPAWAEHVDGNGGAVTRRGWTSRTGMVVEFVESPDDEYLQVSTNGGTQHVKLLQKNKGIEILSEGPVTVKAKDVVTVDGQQDVKVTAAKNVQVTSSGGNIDVSTASGNLTLKGMNVSVEATANLDLKGTNVKATGNATAELAGNATTTVRGGIVRIN